MKSRNSFETSRYLVFAAVLLVVIALVPLWSVDMPPLIDYHNHMARQYILARLPHSDQLQIFYQANWRVMPYLAMDVIVQGLARFVSVETAGKIFLSMMFMLTGLAPIALSLAVQRRVTPISILALLSIHNETVRLGFVHYLFSVGFALCLLALWIRLREARPWVRLGVFPILSTLLFFSHLIGFLIDALTVGAYELGRHIDRVHRRTPRALFSLDSMLRLNVISLFVQFVLPLGIYALYGPSTTVVGQNSYGGIWRKLELLQGMFSYLIPPYLWTLDRILATVFPVALVLLVALRKLKIAKHMIWPLLALFVLLLAMPWAFLGGFGADHRLLPALALLLAASLTWRTADDPKAANAAASQTNRESLFRPGSLDRLSQRWGGSRGTIAFGLIGILIVVRAAAITLGWRSTNGEYAEYQRAFEFLRDGSRVYYAFGRRAGASGRSASYFLPCLAVARKDVYLPYLFTSNGNPGINMKYTPDYEPLQYLSPGPRLADGQAPAWSATLWAYDYFILGNELLVDVPKELTLVYKASDFAVYKNSSRNAKGDVSSLSTEKIKLQRTADPLTLGFRESTPE